jgi:hypothetical protein
MIKKILIHFCNLYNINANQAVFYSKTYFNLNPHQQSTIKDLINKNPEKKDFNMYILNKIPIDTTKYIILVSFFTIISCGFMYHYCSDDENFLITQNILSKTQKKYKYISIIGIFLNFIIAAKSSYLNDLFNQYYVLDRNLINGNAFSYEITFFCIFVIFSFPLFLNLQKISSKKKELNILSNNKYLYKILVAHLLLLIPNIYASYLINDKYNKYNKIREIIKLYYDPEKEALMYNPNTNNIFNKYLEYQYQYNI